MQILDCTLRDGGYYNNWDFSREFVQQYLNTARAMGIQFIEIGFRLNVNRGFKGACAFSTDSFLSSLSIDAGLSIGVMINASEFSANPEKELDSLFPDTSRSYLNFVRIAAVSSEIHVANKLARILKVKGYTVFLNLMQMASLKLNELKGILSSLDDSIDILYFADSTGSLRPEEIREFFGFVRGAWLKPLGLHAHDNLSLALANTLAASDQGVEWQDATFMGMGRGPGNSKTELLWLETQKSTVDYNSLIVGQEFIEQRMQPLKERYPWGTDSFYYLAGKERIHPSFIQNLHEDLSVSITDKVRAVQNLSSLDSMKFNDNLLEKVLEPVIKQYPGSWDPAETIKSDSILILAESDQLRRHSEAIEEFIRLKRPYVLALNWNSTIDSSLVDAYITCHPHRILSSLEKVSQNKIPIILPMQMVDNLADRSMSGLQILDYGVHITDNQIQGFRTHCEIPSLLSLPYALAVSLASHCKKIFLAGLEGEFKSQSKYRETEQILINFSNGHPDVSLVSLTATRYSIKQVSVYGF